MVVSSNLTVPSMATIEELRECKIHGLSIHGRYKRGDSYRWRCKQCQVDAVQKHREKIKQDAILYKNGKCERCGYDKCSDALEFHHLDPSQKDFGIGAGTTKSWKAIQEELDKCIMVCSNCHREIHYEIRHN